MSKNSPWFLAGPQYAALPVVRLQHLCYTDLLVAYSRWQLRTMGLAVRSTLLQKAKALPGLFVGDCVQSSRTRTLCSLHFLPLKCLSPVVDNCHALLGFSAPLGGGGEPHTLIYIILFLLI